MPEPSTENNPNILDKIQIPQPEIQEDLYKSIITGIDWAEKYVKAIKNTPRVLFGGNKNKILATGLSLLGIFGMSCQIATMTQNELDNIINPTPQTQERTPNPKSQLTNKLTVQTATATPTYVSPQKIIEGTATAAHQLGLPDTLVDKPENILSREKINKIKRGLILINGQIDSSVAGGSGGLYDVDKTAIFIVTNAHVIKLDVPIIHTIDPTYQGSRNPQIQALQFFRPGIDRDPKTFSGKQIDFEAVPGKDLVVIRIETNSSGYTKEDCLNYEKSDKAPEKAVVMGFPDPTRADTFEAIAYINQGEFYGRYKPDTTDVKIFEYNIPLWKGNSGGLLVANDENSPHGYVVVGVPTYFGHKNTNNVNFTGAMSTGGIDYAVNNLKKRHPIAQISQ